MARVDVAPPSRRFVSSLERAQIRSDFEAAWNLEPHAEWLLTATADRDS